MSTHYTNRDKYLPSVEEIQKALGQVENLDDFFGKEGIFARLFARTVEEMLEGEMSEHLGYEKYEAKGRNKGNSRNGKREVQLATSGGSQKVQVPRDRHGEFAPKLLTDRRSNELEEKIIALYAKGTSTRDVVDTIADIYGVEVSAATISTITDKVLPLVEEWQSRRLDKIYPIIYLDAIHIKIRQEQKIENVAVYIVLAVDTEGHKDVLGHWVGDGAEGASFWLNVVTDLQTRGVADIFIACVDGLEGFAQAIHAVFPRVIVQRCVIHQIRNSLKYVTWSDHKELMRDLKTVYKAATREEAETHLLQFAEKWGKKYPMVVRSWENNWSELSVYFDYPDEIRRLIYTTNAVEGYNRQLRKVTKTKSLFPTPKSVRKLLYLAHQNVAKKWTMPIPHWAQIRNQLAILFEDRFPV
jgi:putative transposase